MLNRPLVKFLICTGIPLLILLGMTITPLRAQFFGEEILLKTRPVDPRDVFRGDYVVLSYEISRIPIEKAPEAFKDQEQWSGLYNRPVYVLLKPQGEYYEVDQAVLERPSQGIYLEGKFNYPVWPEGPSFDVTKGPQAIEVTYPLDQFFVPENTGTDLEALAQKGQLTAKVRVLRGYGTLIGVY